MIGGTPKQANIILRDEMQDNQGTGVYHYTAYTLLGRMLYGARHSRPFLIISGILLMIPGESFFYGVFFLLFVPYQLYAYSRLNIVSETLVGACPTCRREFELPLRPEDRLTFWKYCPHCGVSIKSSEC